MTPKNQIFNMALTPTWVLVFLCVGAVESRIGRRRNVKGRFEGARKGFDITVATQGGCFGMILDKNKF